MAGVHDIFGPGSNVRGRVFLDYDALEEQVKALKVLHTRIVLTSGTYDLVHVGHGRYLEKARQNGDFLIVGVDSDEKVRQRKGEHRPIVPQDERIEILCHMRHVDAVFLKNADDPHMRLIQVVRPDVLIMTQGSYKEEEHAERLQYCGQIVVLEPQAMTSTTAKIRLALVGPINELRRPIHERLESIKQEVDRVGDDINVVIDRILGGDA